MKKTKKLSVCGIVCDECKHKSLNKCLGCQENNGLPFWGECKLYKCAKDRNCKNCGMCEEFPCNVLREWSCLENPERIENLYKASALQKKK